VVLASTVAACGVAESDAYKTYKSFVNAVIRGDCSTMYALTEKDAVAFADLQCKPRSMNLMGKTIDLGSPASYVASMRPNATPFNDPIMMERTIESETRSPGTGAVDLLILEKSFQRRGNIVEPTWLRRHTVTVEKREGRWKLTRFKEDILRDYGGEEAERQSAKEKQAK
jgi:hypothetical protein